MITEKRRKEELAIAMNKLLAIAKLTPRTPVNLTYTGVDRNGRDLWEVRHRNGAYIALQGNEEQVLRSIRNSYRVEE